MIVFREGKIRKVLISGLNRKESRNGKTNKYIEISIVIVQNMKGLERFEVNRDMETSMDKEQTTSNKAARQETHLTKKETPDNCSSTTLTEEIFSSKTSKSFFRTKTKKWFIWM